MFENLRNSLRSYLVRLQRESDEDKADTLRSSVCIPCLRPTRAQTYLCTNSPKSKCYCDRTSVSITHRTQAYLRTYVSTSIMLERSMTVFITISVHRLYSELSFFRHKFAKKKSGLYFPVLLQPSSPSQLRNVIILDPVSLFFALLLSIVSLRLY